MARTNWQSVYGACALLALVVIINVVHVESVYDPNTGNNLVVLEAQCPHGHSGLMEHPVYCDKFLNCANGATYIQDCGPGTVFNPLPKYCDWPQNVNCGFRIPYNKAGSQSQNQYGNGGYVDLDNPGQGSNQNNNYNPNNYNPNNYNPNHNNNNYNNYNKGQYSEDIREGKYHNGEGQFDIRMHEKYPQTFQTVPSNFGGHQPVVAQQYGLNP